MNMARAPLPKPLCKSINTSKMCPTDFTASLSDVLQSEPVKRLFNQPNIVIKTFPSKMKAHSALKDAVPRNKKVNNDSDSIRSAWSELTANHLQLNQGESMEDVNFWTSMKQGKSEITIIPINVEKKPCGHCEPCENIVCDVAVQQYVDHDGSSPMLAINIEESEINASVSKHCDNEKCDALSIDHDRCRRAIVRLGRYDHSKTCDICGIPLKTNRSRISHKNCKRKNEYRHNDTSGIQILQERMREREMQMMESLKMKRNNNLDPVTANNLAMESLRNNKELIIIPKSVSLLHQQQQQPAITVTSVPASKATSQMDNVNNVLGKLLPSIPIVLPHQNIILGKGQCSNENRTTNPVQVALQDTLNKPQITTNTVPLSQNQYITFTSQSNAHQIPLNDLLLSQSQVMTTPIQPKPLLTPIRVVPITNLITEPSLLHQTQGIPKFCIMADSTVPPPLALIDPQHGQQPESVPNLDARSNARAAQQRKKKSTMRKKRKLKKKDFKCKYCNKSFSTDWYFKVHVAKHTQEKRFSCKICTQSFSNRYDVKRHMCNEHERNSNDSAACDQRGTKECLKCFDCNIVYASLDLWKRHMQKCHGITEKEEVPPNLTETKIDNQNSQEEIKRDDIKMNGRTYPSNQDIVKTGKTELRNKV